MQQAGDLPGALSGQQCKPYQRGRQARRHGVAEPEAEDADVVTPALMGPWSSAQKAGCKQGELHRPENSGYSTRLSAGGAALAHQPGQNQALAEPGAAGQSLSSTCHNT